MEIGATLSKLSKAFPGTVLEARPFGRSHASSLWIELGAVEKVAAFLASAEGGSWDFLENLSAAEVDGALVVTYFLRRGQKPDGETLVLRGSLKLPGPLEPVAVASVLRSWRMVLPFEEEIAAFYGVEFRLEGELRAHPTLLPEGWIGFPLRKDYAFPNEFDGMTHVREWQTPQGEA